MQFLVNNTTPSKVTYKGKPVKEIQCNDETIWSIDPSINVWKLVGGYLNGPLSNYKGITEYNSHNIFYFDGNIEPDYINLTYYKGKYNNLSYTTNFIYCNGEFYDFIIANNGSAGCGPNAYNSMKFSYVPFDTSISDSYYEAWYRSNAGYTIDGSYSTRLYHLSPKGGTLKSTVGKYLQLLGSIDIEDWYEIGREQTSLVSAADYITYHSIRPSKLMWVNNNQNTLKINITNDKIISDVSTHNDFHLQDLYFSYPENNTDKDKHQFLLYYSSGSSYQGYLPDTSVNVISSSPLYIFVQDSINDPFIYWNYAIDNSYTISVAIGTPYKAIPKNDNVKVTLSTDLNDYDIEYCLNDYNYVSVSNLKKNLNNELNHTLLFINYTNMYLSLPSYQIYGLHFFLFTPEGVNPKFHVICNSISYILPDDLNMLNDGESPTDETKLNYHINLAYSEKTITYNNMPYTCYQLYTMYSADKATFTNTGTEIKFTKLYLENITF